MPARRHHYVPQCYLRGFVRHPEKPKLFVVDGKSGKSFHTHPINVAQERDFHAIDIDGLAPDALEGAFAEFEGKLAPALERIKTARSLKDEDDRAYLFNLMALLAIKNPSHRENMRRFQEDVSFLMMELALATPERWAEQVRRAKADGYIEADADADYEQMKALVRDRQFKVNMPTTRHLQMELQSLEAVLPCFFERKWILLRTPAKATGFITSDRPVALMWSEVSRRGVGFHGPGLGMMGTQIVFSISNDLAIMGAFEATEGEYDASPMLIAQINSSLVFHSNRQVYARDSDFIYQSGRTGALMRGAYLANERVMPAKSGPRMKR